MSIASLTKDILTIIKHHSFDEVTLVGFSWGGKIAMQTALRYPRKVNKLVVVDIFPVDLYKIP